MRWGFGWVASASGRPQAIRTADHDRACLDLVHEVRLASVRHLDGAVDPTRPAEGCPLAQVMLALSDDAAFRCAGALCALQANGAAYADLVAFFELHLLGALPRPSDRGKAAAWWEFSALLASGERADGRPMRAGGGSGPVRLQASLAVFDELGFVSEVAQCLSARGSAAAFAMVRRMRTTMEAVSGLPAWTPAALAAEALYFRGLLPTSLDRVHLFGPAAASFSGESPSLTPGLPAEGLAKVHRAALSAGVGGPLPSHARLGADQDHSIRIGGRLAVLSETMGRAALQGCDCFDLAASARLAGRRVVACHGELFPDAGAWRRVLDGTGHAGRPMPELALAAIAFGIVPDPGRGPDSFAADLLALTMHGVGPIGLAAAQARDAASSLRRRIEAASSCDRTAEERSQAGARQ